MAAQSKKSFKNLGLTILATILCGGINVNFDEANAQVQNISLNDISLSGDIRPNVFNVSFSKALEAGRVGKRNFSSKEAIKAFYSGRNETSYWTNGTRVFNQADRMFKAIEESWTHGLNPYKYHYSEIYHLMDQDDHKSRAELELLLTDAFIRYARDLSGKRVSGRPFKLDEKDWKHPISSVDAAHYLSENTQSFKAALKNIEPKGQTYKILRKELIRLVNQGADERESLLPIVFKGLMKPGWDHKEIPRLRQFLDISQPNHSETVYDDELAAAVIRFQRRNALNPDGVIGKNTLEVINRTHKAKIEQIVVNMERLRWVDNSDRGDKFVIVNLPSAMLWGIEDGDVELEMPVIVGSPERRTRSFKTVINGVRINPDWTVPPTIKRYDILPKVQKDVGYLSSKGMELYRGYGSQAVNLDPAAIDWHNISLKQLHGIRMVQGPGNRNPLGRYRLLMPNDYNIYLHDTNKPELFNKPERAASSGCMRMKYPEKMAKFLLHDIDGWNESKTQRVLDSYKKTDISIPHSVPVYIFYYTAWVGDNGQIVYGNDIYNHDSRLIKELRKLDGFYIPSHNEKYQGEISNARLVSFQ